MDAAAATTGELQDGERAHLTEEDLLFLPELGWPDGADAPALLGMDFLRRSRAAVDFGKEAAPRLGRGAGDTRA